MKNKSICKKGQTFSVDAIIGSIILIGIIVSSAVVWNHIADKSALVSNSIDLNFVARNAFNSLIETEGEPYNWSIIDVFNTSNVKALGLSSENDLKMDVVKIRQLSDRFTTDYDDFIVILGLQGYDFQLLIDTWNGSDYVNQYTIGNSSLVGVERQFSAKRYIILNGTRARASIDVW